MNLYALSALYDKNEGPGVMNLAVLYRIANSKEEAIGMVLEQMRNDHPTWRLMGYEVLEIPKDTLKSVLEVA